MRTYRSIARVGLASLLGSLAAFSATSANADTAPSSAPGCDSAALTCSVGTAPLHADLKNQLPTIIDSGMMDKGLIKVRTRFTIDPVKGAAEPLVSVDMPKGALLKASWSEKGFIEVTPVAEPDSKGTIAVKYTLVPSLEASIYGVGVNYDATTLLNKIPGARINYEAAKSATFSPWGFAGAPVSVPAPKLENSTLFSLPFTQLGVGTGTVTGALAIQAAAAPTFTYKTKSIRLDSGTITKEGTSAKLSVGDADFIDIGANIAGEIAVTGNLDVKPVVKIDTVANIPTLGLTTFSFAVVSKPIGGAPVPVSFQAATIHIPLPNVKVPVAPIGLGDVKAGSEAFKTISIDSTGEMAGRLEFKSSDPQFQVPTGAITVGPKSKYELKVVFKPSSGSAASATITVKSNDPDSPEQTFKVAANGAPLGDESDDGDGPKRSGGVSNLEAPPSDDGCSVGAVGGLGGRGTGYAGLVGVGLGLAVIARRRRSSAK